MDPIIVLVAVAVLLLVYQLFIRKGEEKLDQYGHVIKREKRGSFSRFL